jgi:hypothetical protein
VFSNGTTLFHEPVPLRTTANSVRNAIRRANRKNFRGPPARCIVAIHRSANDVVEGSPVQGADKSGDGFVVEQRIVRDSPVGSG